MYTQIVLQIYRIFMHDYTHTTPQPQLRLGYSVRPMYVIYGLHVKRRTSSYLIYLIHMSLHIHIRAQCQTLRRLSFVYTRFYNINIRKMSNEPSASVLVQTNSGPVRGLRKNTIDNLSYVSFQGIPYAQPPVGELRFKVSSQFQMY